jgi:putative nucleotidyltransferase with HDIG domain
MENTDYELLVKNAIDKGEPVSFRYGFMSRDATDYVMEDLNFLLNQINKIDIKEQVDYFVREFISNANKSNLKRVHFIQLGLDMKDSDTYYQGMKTFAQDFHAKLDLYSQEIEKYRMYTETVFQYKNNILTLTVKNSNLPITQESAKVRALIEKSKAIHDTAEAFMAVGDTSEGAGLGVVTTMIMLRSLGLDEKAFAFTVNKEKKETIVKVEIPLTTFTEVEAEAISDVLVKELDTIPAFPERITKLQQLISDSEVDFQKVANIVQSDVAFTAEILRVVNSAQYMLPQKVSNISNALSLIGVKGLKSLIYSYGAQKILQNHYGRMDQIWEHAFRCASYAFHLTKDFAMYTMADDAYIGGILHDVGKIVVLTRKPGLIEKIDAFCMDKGINGNIIENLAMGVTHAKIGAQIAKKWNFPEQIISVIEYHHKPYLAPESAQKLVHLVYMANQLTHVHENNYSFASMEKRILIQFGIKFNRDLQALEKKLNKYYQDQIEKV